ncbi:hypothetical protein CEXT_443811 [Caerostris extrusa]|uniref:Uncharacterized protein n=1 Tax=Caerostris extrusa TaxID=172846 RepID=A0AAV4N658_CAEEX|nr:hypothetical protein CEXT_443811 [Caerostris extrusa]
MAADTSAVECSLLHHLTPSRPLGDDHLTTGDALLSQSVQRERCCTVPIVQFDFYRPLQDTGIIDKELPEQIGVRFKLGVPEYPITQGFCPQNFKETLIFDF